MTTTTTAQSRIRHTPECRPTAADYVKTRGGKGDLLLRCQSCRQFVVLAPAAAKNTPAPVPERTPKPAPAPVSVVQVSRHDSPEPEPAPELDPNQGSKYVCRDHLRPVTWRGTGCASCGADRAARQRDREEAARKRRAEKEQER